MDVVKNTVEHVNPGQTPVVTLDQPLFDSATGCEEVAGYKPWCKLRLQRRELPTPSCELPTSPAREELTKSLQQHCTYCSRAYIRHCMTYFDDAEDLPEFEDWCHRRAKDIPHFRYWATVLELETLVLVYVRSLRQAWFAMYLAALTELVPWFYALDHTHYGRWIPVHLRDMAALPMKHSGVAREFGAGNCTEDEERVLFYPNRQGAWTEQRIDHRRRWSSRPHWQPKCLAALDDCRTRRCQGHRRVTRWPPTFGEARGHTSSWLDTKCADLVHQWCPHPCQRNRRAWQSLRGRKHGSDCPGHKGNCRSCCSWDCQECEDWPRAVPGFHQRMPGGKDKVNQRRNSSEQAEGVQHFHPEKCELRQTAAGLSQERRRPFLTALHWLPGEGWKPWESSVSSSSVRWRKSPSRYKEWSPQMLWRFVQCPIRGSWYHLPSSWWGRHCPDAETCGCQELGLLCPGCLHTVPGIKASDCVTPGPSLGPLHCWFLERQCEIKAWKRRGQTHGRSSSYTWKLTELPPSGHQQDWAVQVPITSYLHMVWPGWQAAGYHWWRGSPEQATAARPGVARPMQPRRSWQSNVVACIPCSQPWSPQYTNQDSWHWCRGVACVRGPGTATRRWTVASIWHREEFSVPGSPRNSSWPRTREGTGTPYVSHSDWVWHCI